MEQEILLHLEQISKSFPGVKALDHVSIDIKKGEVHALVGENGAGKSTLMNIISGNYKADEGSIFWKGKEVQIESQKSAQDLGISIVYQERSLIDGLNVAENIFAARQPVNRFKLIDSKKLTAMTEQFLETLNLGNISAKTLVGELPPAKQQMVEIAKALSQDPQLLLLDEPTATITETEKELLFSLIKELTGKGVSIIYISHMLTEVFEVADRITVMRDGKCQGTTNASDINIDEIIRMMVGRKLEKHEFESTVRDEVVLDVKSLRGSRFHNINFSLRKGEILSLVGLAGAGRTEVAMAIFGADKSCTGEIYVEGKKVQIGSPLEAIKNGIGYLPEDRKLQGLFLEMSIEENVVSGNLKRIIKRRFLDKRRISAIAEEYKEKLHIAAPSIKGRVINLSGGNQQKVVIAKWLLVNPKILIVDEPTRGVDVGAKQEIYEILRKLASDGTAILMISSELPEAMLLSDRMLVMWNGEVTGELRCGKGHAVEEEEIMRYASGL